MDDLFDLLKAEVDNVRGLRRHSLFDSFDEIFNRRNDNVD